MNFITTILNMRARGMRLLRMPVFVWMTMIVAFLLLFSLPIIAVALFMVTGDRQFGTLFFQPAEGGSAMLWQHLFWLFGHPEVYILILPAMGIVSEVLPVFSRKPLFGYAAVVFAGAAIAFLGFGVWAHHMFSSGIGTVAQAAFGLSTMAIAIPTGIKIFNWLGTMWLGRIRLRTPMLFAIGFVAMFVIGGLSGVTHAVVPADWQQTDTYYIVAHFHYVLFGGCDLRDLRRALLLVPQAHRSDVLRAAWEAPLLADVHRVQPDVRSRCTGWVCREWCVAPGGTRLDTGSSSGTRSVTAGAFLIADLIADLHGELVYVACAGARSPRWTLGRPHPGVVDPVTTTRVQLRGGAGGPLARRLLAPEVRRRERMADRSGKKMPTSLMARLERDGTEPPEPIHLPASSYFPLVMAAGLPLIAYGIVYHTLPWGIPLIVIGAVVTMAGAFGWAVEPAEEEEEPHDVEHAEAH